MRRNAYLISYEFFDNGINRIMLMVNVRKDNLSRRRDKEKENKSWNERRVIEGRQLIRKTVIQIIK